MTRSSRRVRDWILVSVALVLAGPAVAQAQSQRPSVTTRTAADVAQASSTLIGTVRPNGARTSYFFQYGLTYPVYGSVTPTVVLGTTTGATRVTAAITGLTPFTTYHYRIVATNRNGTVTGADHTFKTARQPLALTLSASVNPVAFERATVLGGTLTGTGNVNRQIQLQANPFPYTQGFQTVTNAQLTNASGQFAFPLLSVPVTTQYRVVVPGSTPLVGPVLTLGVAARVGTLTSARRVRTGRRVRFFGTVRPAHPQTPFVIQRQRNGRWITVAAGLTRGSGGGVSRYSRRVRIRRGGLYRVVVRFADGSFVESAGRSVRITRIF